MSDTGDHVSVKFDRAREAGTESSLRRRSQAYRDESSVASA